MLPLHGFCLVRQTNTETVVQAKGLNVHQMPAGHWCWSWTWDLQDEGQPRTKPDPTRVTFTTNSRGRGAFSLDGQRQWLGTNSIDLGTGDLRSAVLELSAYLCEYTERDSYEAYCRREGMRVGSQSSILSFAYECATRSGRR